MDYEFMIHEDAEELARHMGQLSCIFEEIDDYIKHHEPDKFDLFHDKATKIEALVGDYEDLIESINTWDDNAPYPNE